MTAADPACNDASADEVVEHFTALFTAAAYAAVAGGQPSSGTRPDDGQ